MASVRCCSMVTPITVAIFGGCAKLPSSALQEPAVQKVTGKQVWGGETKLISVWPVIVVLSAYLVLMIS